MFRTGWRSGNCWSSYSSARFCSNRKKRAEISDDQQFPDRRPVGNNSVNVPHLWNLWMEISSSTTRRNFVSKPKVKKTLFGVYFYKTMKKWRAMRKKDGKYYYNGSFPTQHEAMVASDELWKRLSGSNSKLNFQVSDNSCIQTLSVEVKTEPKKQTNSRKRKVESQTSNITEESSVIILDFEKHGWLFSTQFWS